MACYVDDAVHPFGRMIMCHLWADTLDELLAMVDRIGVQRKWLQQPPKASWVHFDISKGKRALAVAAGAIETDRFGPSEHTARLKLKSSDPVVAAQGSRMLERIKAVREQRALHAAEVY